MSEQDPNASAFDPKAFLAHLSSRPGVYRMLDGEGAVIYVGKARNLKRRVASYFRGRADNPKVRAMVAQVRDIEVTVTHTETEALILENHLIKALRPRYNVLLRDDKSYPYIHLSDDEFPRLGVHRGSRSRPGRYFGPYPSAGAVKESLSLLQKLFPVRQCENGFYRNRSRPCLQYQIERCSGPCVGLVDRETYMEDVRHAVLFLEGRSSQVIDDLAQRMEAASAALEFEAAARYRDQIARLSRVQEKQYVSGERGDLDVVAAVTRAGVACVQVFSIRGGRNLGNKAFFPRNAEQVAVGEVLGAFLPQYYLGHNDRGVPPEVLVNAEPEDAGMLAAALGEQSGRQVAIRSRLRGERARWVAMAVENAEHALGSRLAAKTDLSGRFEALQEALGLEAVPQRMECFDISHTGGEAAVASCVVFDQEGPVKSDYRRFNIRDIEPGDDYAAMQQALERRFRRLKEGEGPMPDLLLVDGGKGQLARAEQVLEELQVVDVAVVGVAKGPTRKPGLEQLFLSGHEAPIILPADSPALHLIQHIRDEAHRFAITGHRGRRGRQRRTSSLEEIPGLGPKRRRELLRQFGGLQEVARAGVEDLSRVSGISRRLAQRIYETFHSGDS